MNYKLKKISGDASFREFYRLQKGKNTSIIVQAKKEKFKNLITYIVVNKILAKYKIYAPKLMTNHYEHNIIEITDLGQKSFYNSIIKKKNKFEDYKNLIKLIIKLQNIKLQRNYRLGKFKINFQNYSIKNLHKESDLFFDWYLKYCFKSPNLKKIKNILKEELITEIKIMFYSHGSHLATTLHISGIPGWASTVLAWMSERVWRSCFISASWDDWQFMMKTVGWIARSLLKSRRLPRLRTHVSVHGRFTGKTGRGTLVSGADDGRRAWVNSIARIPCRITPPETTQRRLEAVRATAIDSTLLAVPPTFPNVSSGAELGSSGAQLGSWCGGFGWAGSGRFGQA